MEFLEQLDQQFFVFLNACRAPWADVLFFYISKPLVSLPIYLFVIFLLFKKFSIARACILLGILIAVVGLADYISVVGFKNVFLRYRPSHNVDLQGVVNLVHGYKGGKYGFVSSHAANTFAFTAFAGIVFKSKKILVSLILWAALVSYSRIYLGVHYPADIVCGALLGILLAVIVFVGLRKMYPHVLYFKSMEIHKS